MTAILVVALVWLVAAGVGRVLLSRLSCLNALPLERFVYASAVGLGVVAYGVYLLGAAGLLTPVWISLWLLFLALTGGRGHSANFADMKTWSAQIRANRNASRTQPNADWTKSVRADRLLASCAVTVLLVLTVLAIVGCFQPPTAHVWDALAYHLADPKLFLLQHRIAPLPTEHHSNFPLTMEMLFTIGLLYNGYAAANLFHLVTTILTTLAIFAFVRRLASARAGYIAALLFATTPLVFWESTVAYTDIGLALYALLAAFAALSATGVPAATRSESDAMTTRRQWAVLAGMTIGFALGIKYLAVVPCVGISIWLLVQSFRHDRSWRVLAAFAVPALLIGSPWYLKNAVVMHNPVYPYLFKLFPHSRYWSLDRALTYDGEQKSFGYTPGAAVKSPAAPTPTTTLGTTAGSGEGTPVRANFGQAVRDLIMTPWRLVAEPSKYQNAGNYTASEWIGGLYAGAAFALVRRRRLSPTLVGLLWLSFFSFAAWFWTAQVGRYLLLVLPLVATLGGIAAAPEIEPRPVDKDADSEPATVPGPERTGADGGTKWVFRTVVILLAGQFALLLWGLFALPTGGAEAAQRYAMGLAPSALSIPDAAAGIAQPETVQARLQRNGIYNAGQWINAHTPAKAGVILYDNVFGYYFNRPWLWGNGEHSSYIGYETLRDGTDLTRRLQQLGVGYAVFDLNFSPKNSPENRAAIGLENGLNGQEETALQTWYAHPAPNEPQWRKLVGDAIARGLWQPIINGEATGRGVIVLAIPDSPAPSQSRNRSEVAPPLPLALAVDAGANPVNRNGRENGPR